MRLQEIKKFLVQINDLLKLESTSQKIGNETYYSIKNWDILSECLHDLSNFSFLKNELNNIYNIGINMRVVDKTVSLSSDQNNIFTTNFSKIVLKCEAVLDFLDSVAQDDVPESINIKLPTTVNNLASLTSIVKDLNIVFSQCPLLKDYGVIKFEGVDVGSSWIRLTTSALAAVTIIANMANQCLDVRKKIL